MAVTCCLSNALAVQKEYEGCCSSSCTEEMTRAEQRARRAGREVSNKIFNKSRHRLSDGLLNKDN